MTLIVETTDNANAKILAALLRNLNFVKAVTFKPEKNNKPNSSIAKEESLTAKDWILPGRPATDDEIEQMCLEMEADNGKFSPEEVMKGVKNCLNEWRKSNK